MIDAKHPLASRTNWFGLAIMLLSLLELFQEQMPAIIAAFTPQANAWITLGVGAGVIVLRFITKTGLSWKKDNAAL